MTVIVILIYIHLQDNVFQAVVNTMINDRTRIWSSVETYKLYQSCGESKISQRTLMWRLSDILPDLLVLSGNGIASILIFRSHVSSQLKIISNENDEEMNYSMNKLAKKITDEVMEMRRDETTCD